MVRSFEDKPAATRITHVYGGISKLRLSKCKLLVSAGEGRVTEYVFDQAVINVGSSPESDLMIDDDTVSREHCRIELDESQYLVRDLGSTNGTFVNGVRVREAYLGSGCLLAVGSVELRFHSMEERIEFAPSQRDSCGHIVGRSTGMREIFGLIEKIAPTTTTIVIDGETGTGKEVAARTIHALSPRAKTPFVVVDCGAIPEHLIESELFGHERGSFTGAIAARQGLFELANGGTLFLDEIGELRLELQPKLLRALEQREIRRVGGIHPIKIDVRVLAATNRDLDAEVRSGRFREDLFYRLSVVRLRLPPLRERREDIPLLVRHFLRSGHFNRTPGSDQMRICGIARPALDALIGYDWPGNIRELLNVIERACSLVETDTIQQRDLPAHISGMAEQQPRLDDEANTRDLMPDFDQTFKVAKEGWVSRFERGYLEDLMRRHNRNITRAAKEASLDRKHLRRLLKKHGLHHEPA